MRPIVVQGIGGWYCAEVPGRPHPKATQAYATREEAESEALAIRLAEIAEVVDWVRGIEERRR